MTINMESYETWKLYQTKFFHLKQKFIEISSLHINATILATLKDEYNCKIYSKRVSDSIKDLSGLLRILENRAVISCNEVGALKEISMKFVKDPVLETIIYEYELQLQTQKSLPLFNVYKWQSLSEASSSTVAFRTTQSYQIEAHAVTILPLSSGSQETSHWNKNLTSLTSYDLQATVFRYLSENLGRHWRDLVRFLGVKESEIDAIDLKINFEPTEKAYEALEIFRSRSKPTTWQRKLLHALKIIRRKDLVEIVEDLICSGENITVLR